MYSTFDNSKRIGERTQELLGEVKRQDHIFKENLRRREITFGFFLVKRKDHIAHPVIHNKKLYIRYAKELLVYDIAKD